jgi:ubiquinol-cytochrome c reductase cytochrome b subunit
MIKRVSRAIDARVGAASWVRNALNHVFPDHWSFMLGEVAMYSFAVLVLTGVYLTLFFDASLEKVVYRGGYAPLHGLQMSAAYRSVVRLSFDVRAGLVIRQIHHWAALVFVGVIVVHAARIFFTGAFRKPRELNWFIGITMLILALANGFAGYSMVDDLLSGIGLRIAYSIGESIPLVGVWLVGLFFGGEFPGHQYLGRLYILHVLVVPVLIATLMAVHLALIWRQKHTQFPGPGRTERNVVGSRLFPTYAARSISLFLGVFAILALLGGLAQINPIWLWGPYQPSATTTAAQPDWYVGWLEGALRLFPPWEIRAFGHVIPNPFFPAILMPGLFFVGMYAYPFIERRLTGDRDAHELLDRPRDHPVRTGLGVGVLTYFVVIFVAGSQDIIASKTGISVQPLVWTLRTLVFVLPALAFLIAWAWCRGLAKAATGEVETSPPIRKIGPGTPPLGVPEDGEAADADPAEVAAFMDRHPLLRRVSRVATSAALAGALRRSRRSRPPPSP